MNKNNYNINLNPKPPHPDRISGHKDFDALLKNFQVQPAKPTQPASAKWIRLISIAAAAAAMIGAFFYFNGTANSTEFEVAEKAYFASQPYINPPIKTVKPTFVNKQLDANQGGIYEYENGSKLTVPPAAFAYGNGDIVQGKVEIHYRQMNDYVDFFLSGIPMEYDSAGIRYHLESAGMVEIYAEQNGKRLNIRPGKEINVELVSEIKVAKNDPMNFNIYRLDTTARNWVYMGLDEIEELPIAAELLEDEEEIAVQNDLDERLNTIKQSEETALAEIEASVPAPIAPVRPERANPEAHVFNFNFPEDQIDYGNQQGETQQNVEENLTQIRQLRKQYENTLWQVKPGNTNFNEEAASQINWEDMQLKQLNNQDYELTLISGNNNMKVVVNPVLSGGDFDKAIQEFNNQFAVYEKQMADRKAQLKDQIDALRKEKAEEEALAKLEFEERLAKLRANGKHARATEDLIVKRIVNRFRASSFGIWNCDRPLPPSIHMVKGEFTDQKQTKYNENTGFLVDKSRNTVVRFFAKNGSTVNFDNNSDNLMWIITKDNKLALYRPEEFKKINKKRGEHTFVMNLIDKEMKSEEDVRKILLF